MASAYRESDDGEDEATAFPADSGEDMTDEEFHTLLRQKVSESVSPE
ncbi:hypothetical protein [Haloparvum sp. AD34]